MWPGFAEGGWIGNGIYNTDSVVARYAGGGSILLAGGEHVMPADVAARYRPELDSMRAGTYSVANDLPALPAFTPAAPPPSAPDGGLLAALRRQNVLLEGLNALLQALLASNADGLLAIEAAVETGNTYGEQTAREARLRAAAPAGGR